MLWHNNDVCNCDIHVPGCISRFSQCLVLVSVVLVSLIWLLFYYVNKLLIYFMLVSI